MKNLFFLFVISLFLFGTAYAEKCTKEQAKEAVERACKLIEKYGKTALIGKKEKLGGEESIAKWRYCGSLNNYVWVQDTSDEVKMVFHPIKRRLNGKSLKGHPTKATGPDTVKGVSLFEAFDKMAKANPEGAWVNYEWTKPKGEKAEAKVSFVKVCPGAQKWIAGSGIWID